MKKAPTRKNNDNICLFMDDFSMGGAQRVFVTLADKLVERGYQVRVLVTRKDGPLLKELSNDVEVIDLKSFRNDRHTMWVFVKTFSELRRYLIEYKPSVIMSTITGVNIVTILAWLSAGKPARLVIREACSVSNVKSRFRIFLMRALYHFADKIVVLSETLRQEIHDKLWVSENKVSVIANPIYAKKISSLAKSRVDELQIRNCKPYILSVGRLVPQKDHAMLVKAFSISETCAENNLIILGDGPERPRLQKLIKALGLEEKVFLIGQKDNPYPWFREAEMFALSSKWEGYSNTLVEALYFSLPIACTQFDQKIGSIIEEFSDTDYYLSPVGDHIRFSRAMEQAFKSKNKRPVSVYDRSQRVIDSYEVILTT